MMVVVTLDEETVMICEEMLRMDVVWHYCLDSYINGSYGSCSELLYTNKKDKTLGNFGCAR